MYNLLVELAANFNGPRIARIFANSTGAHTLLLLFHGIEISIWAIGVEAFVAIHHGSEGQVH